MVKQIDKNTLIIWFLIGLLGIALGNIFQFIPETTAEDFITKCNELNENKWSIHEISQFTTYSQKFWDEYPIIKVGGEVGDPMYSCLKSENP